jgi:uncharacterized protein (DUF433 family)
MNSMDQATTQIPAPEAKDDAEPRIVSTPGTCGGKPRIAGTRIKVQHVATWYERMGMSPDEIVSQWPHLTLADVHAALAYYYAHREQIDADIQEGREFAERLRAGQPSIFDKARRRNAPDDPLPPG